MTSITPSPNPVLNSNELTRRAFMKKSALTASAITLLGQGIGLANENDMSSSGLFHTHKCDGSCPAVTGFGDIAVYGKTEDPPNSGNYKYFPLYNCKCTKDSHALGVHRGPYQTSISSGTIERLYGGSSEHGAVPPEHTVGHH